MASGEQGRPLAVVRIRPSDFAIEWLQAVTDLLEVIDQADPVLVDDGVREAAAQVRRVMFASKAADG